MVSSTKERIRAELSNLCKAGGELWMRLIDGQKKDSTAEKAADPVFWGLDYQNWYTRTLRVVETLAPDRLAEFAGYYEPDPKRKAIDVITYRIRDYANGIAPVPDSFTKKPAWDHIAPVVAAMHLQVSILRSLESRIDDVLADIEGEIASEIQGAGLDTARGLLKVNPRAAGALAGVVLEDHLQRTATARGVKMTK